MQVNESFFFSKTVDFTTLVAEVVSQANIYTTKNSRNLITNELELAGFLGII